MYTVEINSKEVFSTNNIEKAYETFESLRDFAQLTGAYIRIWNEELGTVEDFFGN
jgi:hypothetical protein